MKARIIGRLGKDAELVTIKEKEVLKTTVAEYKSKDVVEWHSVIIRNTSQQEKLKKGALVMCEGYLTISAYINKDGEAKADTTLWATEVEILLLPKKKEGTDVNDLPFN